MGYQTSRYREDQEAAGRVAAIFDVDQTLVQGSTERLFFRYLVRRGWLPLGQAVKYLGRLAARPEERFRDKTYLKGQPVDEVFRLAREFYERAIASRLSREARACVREHQDRGHEIVILTGSLSFLIQPLKEDLGADCLIATSLGREGNRFTGEITGLHPRGVNKRRLVLEQAGVRGWDLKRSYAYGDHIQDFSIFEIIGHPVAVNPGWRLKRLAQRRKWPIRYF